MDGPREVARRVRSTLSVVPLLAVVGLLGCATARVGAAGEVRVLLYEGAGPIVVGAVGQSQQVRIAAGGLVVDGQPSGERWSPRGAAPWQVGRRRVWGTISVRAESGQIQVLNRVDLEAYVASTVGGEMSADWPQEALRAQAVAARTYVLHEAGKRTGSFWDVRATTASQVYRGLAAESDSTRAAARATRGEVLTHGGEPILAVFHSTAGGRTATAGEVWGQDLPYLRVVEVEEEDDAPHTYWRKEFEAEALGRVLAAAGFDIGTVRTLRVAQRTGSGRVEQLDVQGGADRTASLRGRALRRLVSSLALRSRLFEVKATEGGFAFVGSGFGHGVGMSQWGARAMAERGEPYQRILARFYPGTRLERWSFRHTAASGPRSDRGRGRAQGEVQ